MEGLGLGWMGGWMEMEGMEGEMSRWRGEGGGVLEGV